MIDAKGVSAWGYGGQTVERGDMINGQPSPNAADHLNAWKKQVVLCEHELPGTSPIRVPPDHLISRKVVGDAFDAADDWIVEHAAAGTVVVTADILLADRCLKLGATVVAPTGKPFTNASIGSALAMRAIMADLRAGSGITGGPPPFSNADRSRFRSSLDEALVKLRRNIATGSR